ncbi:hypothetical protein GF357_02490 [Candidatus Dojkabacteria bacterium]|nr:hypothetical protein [Candidatus Dojkabacteria bacterium]
MEEIRKKWSHFLRTPFPSSAHEVNLDLEILDTTIAGCITSLIRHNSLNRNKMAILETSIRELIEKFENIPKDEKPYFQQLIHIGKLILKNRRDYIRSI